MRFPLLDQLDLPCVFERIVPGRLHPDGRRYLPLIVLRTIKPGAPEGLRLGVVDRHHLVNAADVGQTGTARLVCALSVLRLQAPPLRQGIFPEANVAPGEPSLAPQVCGRVAALAAWDVTRGQLPYEVLYTELLLDIGLGTVGLRTSMTADNMAEHVGKAQLEAGDWILLERSRIDILGFVSL